jgi:hypothetical protein
LMWVRSSSKLMGKVRMHTGSFEGGLFLKIVCTENFNRISELIGNNNSLVIFRESESGGESTHFRLGNFSESMSPFRVMGMLELDNVSGLIETVSKRDKDVVIHVNLDVSTSPIFIGLQDFLLVDFLELTGFVVPFKDDEGWSVLSHDIEESSVLRGSHVVGTESSVKGMGDFHTFLPFIETIVVHVVPTGIKDKEMVIHESVLIDSFDLGVGLAIFGGVGWSLGVERSRNLMFENSPVHRGNSNSES